ncbi:amino acid ABC transporter permease [Burkholderia sp. Leaf177]|uniref:amino acid ABC transporter permease n=1 Tax=Burkholderia sp. Leaf177 TaxID=1736287 RepID=UPI000700FC1A|nr:amino acid ABC transporter permease [Burkholderia sp. Leaf177]KQR81778.1 amino acid ABC transporter permease [Burkholderia sp. Leaf177]
MTLDLSWLADPLYQTWLLRGIGMTVSMCICAIALMFVIGIMGAALIYFRLPVLETITTIVVELLRNTPPLVQLFVLYFTLSELGLSVRNLATGQQIPVFSGFTCMVLSLALYNGAIAVEIIRSGLHAVPYATVEAALSLGYSRPRIFWHIQLPIALRLSTVPMTNNIVSLIKTSSQAAFVAVADVMYYATQITLENFRNLEVMLTVWVIYLLLASVASTICGRIGHALQIPGYGV